MLVTKLSRDAGHDLHQRRRHHDRLLPERGLVPAAHEPFRPAVLRRPLRRIRVTVVIRLLHHALLVLGRQHRQDRRNLHVPHPKPVLVFRARGMQVTPRPLARHGRVRVLGGAAAPARLREQRLVVLLRGLERVRAHDRLARVIAVAITPRRRRRRIVADQPILAPEILERGGAVAAEVARVAPETRDPCRNPTS